MKPRAFSRIGASLFAGTLAIGCNNIEDLPYYLAPLFQGLSSIEQKENPLVGFWVEERAFSCDGRMINQQDSFSDIQFRSNNTFTCDLGKFENFDYWGNYSYNTENNQLIMTITGGNYIPINTDLEGTAFISGGALHLENIFLGYRPDRETREEICSYVAEEVGRGWGGI